MPEIGTHFVTKPRQNSIKVTKTNPQKRYAVTLLQKILALWPKK